MSLDDDLDKIIDEIILATDGDLEKMDEVIAGGKKDNDDTTSNK